MGCSSLVIFSVGLEGGGLRLWVAVRGGLIRGSLRLSPSSSLVRSGLRLSPSGGLVLTGLSLPLSRLVQIGLKIGLNVRVSSLMRDSSFSGLFCSWRSVVHSSLFFKSTERSFFSVEFRSVVSRNFFNDFRRINVSLTVLVLVIVVVSSIRRVFESVNISGSSNIGRGLIQRSFLF